MIKKLLAVLFIVSASTLNAQTLTFTNKADMITPRAGFSSGNDGTFQYIANGFAPLQPYTSQIEKYDFANNSWSTLTTSTPTIAKRYGNGGVLSNNLYLYNGVTATGKNDKFEIVNLTTGEVTVSPNLNPNPVYSAASAIYGDYLLSLGGCVSAFEGVYSSKFYKISPFGEWTALADLPIAAETKAAVVYGNGSDAKLYAIGGYSQTSPMHENFETVATTGNLALADWTNVAETGTKVFQGKQFGLNKYAQMTAFAGPDQEASNIAWLISPTIDLVAGSYLTFDTKDGYDNGATLQAFLVTNWTGDITTSDKSLLPANISSGHTAGYAADFTSSGILALNGAVGSYRIAFKYTGGYAPLATTTFQIDNVRLYSENKSHHIYEYDFNTDAWTAHLDVLPIAVSAHAVAVDNPYTQGKIYITGDYDYQDRLTYYDTANGTLTTLGQNAMVGRRHHAAEIFNNNLYLFGGNTTPQSSSTLNSTQSANLSVLATPGFGKQPTISFYPNPATHKINFNADIKSVSLFTFEGKKIDATLQNNTLDISGLNNGIYLIQGLEKDGSSFSDKLIKN